MKPDAEGPRPGARQVLGDQARFLKKLIERPRLTGSVAPSGRALARAMALRVDPARDGLVIELGPGTGPVTQALIERGITCDRLTLVEYDRGFCQLLAKRFAAARIVQGDAYDLPRTLGDLAGAPIVAVVSSLPLLNEAPARRVKLIEDAFALMGPLGLMVQFTYGFGSPIPRETCAHRFSAHARRADLAQPAAGFRLDLSRRPERRLRRAADRAADAPRRAGAAAPQRRMKAPMRPTEPRDRLIVALDAPDLGEAERLVAAIGETGRFYKIGMELAYGGGLALTPKLVAAGKRVFVDLKLHDIPNTVERATAQIARLGATFLTVHAYPQTMRAAVAGAKGSGLKLLAVSVLTSSDDSDLAEAGYAFTVSELVERRARQAVEAGVAGLVCSPAEAGGIRALVGDALLLVTPGVRPAGAAAGDQKRVATPVAAIARGADYVVVGRPITQSPDPRAAAERIVTEMAGAA